MDHVEVAHSNCSRDRKIRVCRLATIHGQRGRDTTYRIRFRVGCRYKVHNWEAILPEDEDRKGVSFFVF